MLGITNLQETRFYQEAKEDGERTLTLRLLSHRFGELSPALVAQIEALSLPQIEALAKALLDFQSLTDLEAWLGSNE